MFQGAARARAATKEDEEEAEPSTPAGVDVVSLYEAEAAEEKVAETVAEDIDVEEEADAQDDFFLEEEEEDDDDVTNLIDGDIAPDEEGYVDVIGSDRRGQGAQICRHRPRAGRRRRERVRP